MRIGRSETLKRLGKILETDSAGAHVGHVELIHCHQSCDHVEIGFVVSHHEPRSEFLHDGRCRDQCVGARAEAHNHDFAAVPRIVHCLGDHARYANTLENHIGGTACCLFDLWKIFCGDASRKRNVRAEAHGALAPQLFRLGYRDVISAHEAAPKRNRETYRACAQNQYPLTPDVGAHIDGM